MVEILRNTPFRMLFIVIPAIFVCFRKKHIKIDIFIIALILNAIASEIFTYFHHGYNLVQYSVFTIIDILIISSLVWYETKANKLVASIIVLVISLFAFFMLTEYSSMDLMTIENNFPLRTPLDTQQFFDFCSLLNLITIVLCFFWLYKLVNQTDKPHGGTTKRFIYLFGILAYYSSSFFTLAFGRYIVGDITIWFEYWNKIYLPLYLLFYLTLNIGLLWKPAPTPSSSY